MSRKTLEAKIDKIWGEHKFALSRDVWEVREKHRVKRIAGVPGLVFSFIFISTLVSILAELGEVVFYRTAAIWGGLFMAWKINWWINKNGSDKLSKNTRLR